MDFQWPQVWWEWGRFMAFWYPWGECRRAVGLREPDSGDLSSGFSRQVAAAGAPLYGNADAAKQWRNVSRGIMTSLAVWLARDMPAQNPAAPSHPFCIAGKVTVAWGRVIWLLVPAAGRGPV